MNADIFIDNEFHPRQPHARIGHHRRAERQIRIAEIDHDLRLWQGKTGGVHARDFERNFSLIDGAGLSAGAGDRDQRAGLESRSSPFQCRPPPARRVRAQRWPRDRCVRRDR